MTTGLHLNVAPLRNVAAFLTLVERLQNRPLGVPGMACFHGRSGYGKTTAGIFAQNKMGIVHVEATYLGGTKELLLRIVRELGQRPLSSAARLAEQATEQLARTQRTLVIDEADFVMTERTMQTLRKIQDDSGAPVILMGEQTLPGKIGQFPQAHRRILDWVEAEPAQMSDVHLLAALHCPGVDLAPDLVAALFEASGANQGYITTNLLNMHAHCAVRGIGRLTAADWPRERLHTGQPPTTGRPVRGRPVAEAAGATPGLRDLVRGAHKRGAA